MNLRETVFEEVNNSTANDKIGETNTLSLVTCCPITGERVLSEFSMEPIPIPNGQGVWWHCSVCQGWHFLIEKLDMALL